MNKANILTKYFTIMTGKITYFKAEDFNQKAVFNQFHSECQLNEVSLKKSDTLKHEEIQQVMDICKKYNSLGANAIIVKDESSLTIWIEDAAQAQALVTTKNAPETKVQHLSSEAQALPTKTVTKRYRGQEYEETVIDWTAVAMQKQGVNTGNKSRRKYRGNYID